MKALEIVDKILPLTKEDNRCGFQKAKKLKARAEMITLINDFKEGKAVVLNDEILKLLNEH